MKPRDFIRKIGFGLRPDEDLPSQPTTWAKDQIWVTPDLVWPDKLYSHGELNSLRQKYLSSKRKINKAVQDKQQRARELRQLKQKTGYSFFENYELAIRHHQAIYSENPVFERFWHFWCNHFAIIAKAQLPVFSTGVMHRDVIRRMLSGRFADLAFEATISWPMIKSLDNFKSFGEQSTYNRKRLEKNLQVRSLNENHARELLELHTVSTSAKYTQHDVINVARIMSGWTLVPLDKKLRPDLKVVAYRENMHEPGTHHVLGRSFATKENDTGQGQLRDLIEFVASTEECARFISWKLCRHFICDEPEVEMVEKVAKAWITSGGNLPDIHAAVIDMTWEWGKLYSKIQSPETWLISTARMSGSSWLGSPLMFDGNKMTMRYKKRNAPTKVLKELGHNPFRARQPDGFPDTSDEWLSPELLARRLAVIYGAEDLQLIAGEQAQRGQIEHWIKTNFDDPEELLNLQRSLQQRSQAEKFVGLFCSRRMLKV